MRSLAPDLKLTASSMFTRLFRGLRFVQTVDSPISQRCVFDGQWFGFCGVMACLRLCAPTQSLLLCSAARQELFQVTRTAQRPAAAYGDPSRSRSGPIMSDAWKTASDLLLDHWKMGTTLQALPEDVRPLDSAHGYGIQQHVVRLTGQPLFGWKIAATSTAGQGHINVNRPLAGRILQERVIKYGDPVPCM